MILVTGGGGFLGSHIVRRLLARGEEVRVLQRSDAPGLTAAGVTVQRGDLADLACVQRACAGCETVFHVAAKAGVWGAWRDYHRANILGTTHILAACHEQGVARLVYTSTPSVVFDGHDENGIDESAPYCARPYNHYQRSKRAAEEAVLAASDRRLATVALRPHLIYGPGDPHLVPRILDRARRGSLKLIAGPEKRVDATDIANATEAHLCAWQALHPEAACAGRAYFVGNDAPLAMNALINRILAAAGLPPVEPTVPPWLADVLGTVLEVWQTLLRRPGEPLMTRFVARQLACAHWFNLSAIKRDCGYVPVVDLDASFARLTQALSPTEE